MRVTIGGTDFEDTIAQFENRNVERTAAEIIHGDLLVFLLFESVRQRRRRRLVNNAQHFQARDASRVFRRLTLGIVEVRRHGDDRLCDRLAEILLGRLLHRLQDHGRDFGRRVFLAAHGHAHVAGRVLADVVRHQLFFFADFGVTASHEPLDREDRVLWIGDCLSLGNLPYETFAFLGEGHHRRRGTPAFGVGDYGRIAALDHGDTRVGRPQIDAYDFTHSYLPPCPLYPFGCGTPRAITHPLLILSISRPGPSLVSLARR